MITTSPMVRIRTHCIPFTSCAIYEDLPVTRPTTTVSIGPRKLWVYEEQGDIIAEWLPQQSGMYTRGHGQTVLEAIGFLCLYDQVVELAGPCEVVDRRWSVEQPAPDRR
jgi:hypothetical protein